MAVTKTYKNGKCFLLDLDSDFKRWVRETHYEEIDMLRQIVSYMRDKLKKKFDIEYLLEDGNHKFKIWRTWWGLPIYVCAEAKNIPKTSAKYAESFTITTTISPTITDVIMEAAEKYNINANIVILYAF